VVSFIEPTTVPRHEPDPESTTRLDGLPPFVLLTRLASASARTEGTRKFVKTGSHDEADGRGRHEVPPSAVGPAPVVIEQLRSADREAPTEPVTRTRPAAEEQVALLLPGHSRHLPPWSWPAPEGSDSFRPSAPGRRGPPRPGAVAFGAVLVVSGLVVGALAVIVAMRHGVDLASGSARQAVVGAGEGPGRAAGLAPTLGDAGSAWVDGAAPGFPEGDAAARRPAPLLVCDQRFWAGGGGNRAVAVSAKFTDRDRLARALDLSRSVGEFNGRSWSLSEVLIDLDLNASGYSATWRVSGPGALITAHVDEVRRLEQSGEVYDLSIADIEVATAGQLEGLD
jgi:hypothetical protein